MKKKYTAVLASAAALALMLTGCTGEKGGTTSSAGSASSVSSGVTSTADGSSQEEEPIQHMNSMVFMNGANFPGMTVSRNDHDENGGYWYEDVTEDGIRIVSRCVPTELKWMDIGDFKELNETIVHSAIDAETYDFEVENAANENEFKNSFPTYYSMWKSGGNEDTVQHHGVIVTTDNYTYIYELSVHIDSYDDVKDSFKDILMRVQLEEVQG